ncbi:dihydroxy-acid dehydratase [Nocardioides sp. LMS-CY]|uniref:Dihydroxy-acid dehydratase n=1 Tax=Nocardioides soli TaxID=1036020 RepID=A0A7W4Z3L0_9ACTN|nr:MULTISPECIES: dihydroxy-acid dehydratase [Nocardioides]MBB3043820.1 dihydroxy-acid dehydratase [Nocardioides soli]QWF20743.1 dihydroxy-acid dehydratase [Nocardioides sp. LMS-CY]
MPDNPATSAIDASRTSYGDEDFSRFLRRAFLASSGYDDVDLDRPIIGIAVTTSSYNTCHRDMPALVDAVKRGVLEAGGLPLTFPTVSLGEILTSPTSMLYRNLMAMDTEEMIQALPMDAAVLLGGCDKTVPAQLMAAASSDKPVLLEVVGPMMTGQWRGERMGACTDCRRLWAGHRAGELDAAEIAEARGELVTTAGTCAVMGTASTMACMTETLGMMLPGGATPGAATGERLRHGTATGRRAVSMAREGAPLPREVLTRAAFDNAIKVLAALGGSTNALVHLLAVARRAGVELELADFDTIGAKVPLLVDCKPSGSQYLQDFHHSGGLPALLKVLEPELDTATRGIAGQPLSELLGDVPERQDWQTTILPLDRPLGPAGALAVVRGTLAPNGAVIKTSAASPRLLQHTGPALVLEADQDIAAVLDDPDLDVTPDHVLVLRSAGPRAAGMPEAGALPIPKKLARQGVRDMVRVSDARMSGTSYGTVVLHCDPEAAASGPLAVVRNGDLVRLDVENRRLDLLVEEDEVQRRLGEYSPPPLPERGWRRLYAETVLPASQGADLSFL